MSKYSVRFYQDNLYEVVDILGNSVYRGRLADCEAWIRLKIDRMLD